MSTRGQLIERIEAFLGMREMANRPLDRWECEHLIRAIAFVPTRDLADQGILAMNKAMIAPDKRSPEEIANIPTTYEISTLAQSRNNFENFKRKLLR